MPLATAAIGSIAWLRGDWLYGAVSSATSTGVTPSSGSTFSQNTCCVKITVAALSQGWKAMRGVSRTPGS